jgi:plasmid stability protein
MVNITLKNIPDDLYDRVKESARLHRRSINGEIIARLEAVLPKEPLSPEERLELIRQGRPQFDPNAISLEELLEAIDEGRS